MWFQDLAAGNYLTKALAEVALAALVATFTV